MQLNYSDTFTPQYKGKLFVVKPAKLSYGLDIDVDPMTDEGKAVIKLTENLWKKEMASFRKAKEKEYADAIKITELNIYKTLAKKAQTEKDPKKLDNWLQEEAKGANVMIVNAIKTLESVVGQKAREVYEKAAAAVDKKYKTHLRNQKIKAVLKIAAHVTLILVAGALAIAAAAAGVALTAATLGVGAVSFAAVVPVAIGALVTIAKSAKSIHSTIQKDWPTADKGFTNLGKAVESLIKSVEYQNKKKEKKDLTGKLGPKERLKLLMNDIKGDVKSVEKNITNCKAYAYMLSKKIELLAQEVTKIQAPIDDLLEAAKADPESKDAKKSSSAAQKLVDQQIKLIYDIDKSRDFLNKLSAVLNDGEKLVTSTNVDDTAKLKGFLGNVQRIVKNETLKDVLTEGKAVLEGAAKLAKALS